MVMEIKVVLFDGTSIVIEGVHTQDTILEFKRKIQQKVPGFPATKQILIFAGTTLEDDKTLGNYGVTSGSEVRLLIESVGGGSQLNFQ